MTYGGSGDDQFIDVCGTTDNGIVAVGKTNSFGNGGYDALIVKTDDQGNISWARTLGGVNDDYFKQVSPTNDGGVIAVGATASFGQIDGDAWAVKFDAKGNISWIHNLGIDRTDFPAACQTTDGGYALTARTNVSGPTARFYVIKLDSTGSFQWGRYYFSFISDYSAYIKQTNDGNLVVTGFTKSFGAGGHDAYLMKVSIASGNVLWLKSYGSPGDDGFDCISEAPDGSLFVSGLWNSGSGNTLLKTDKDGNLIWDKLYVDPGIILRGWTNRYTNDGGHIIGIDETTSPSGRIIKTDSLGNIMWERQYQSIPGSTNTENKVFVLNNGEYAVGGYTNGSGTNDGYLIKADSLGETGSCSVNNPQAGVMNITPLIQNQTWANVLSLSGIQTINVAAVPVNLNRDVLCESICCHDTTIVQNARICAGTSYMLPDSTCADTAGTYTTHFTLPYGCDSTIITHLTVNENPIVELGNDTSICQNTSLTLNPHLDSASYLWQDGSTAPEYTVSQTGEYVLTATNEFNCKASDSVFVNVVPDPLVNLGNDTNLCAGTSLILNAAVPGYHRYLWQDGSEDSIYTVAQAGTYSVTVTDSIGCTGTDSVQIAGKNKPEFAFATNVLKLCPKQVITLNAATSDADSYQWQNGSTTPELTVDTPGVYSVAITNVCGTVSDSVNVIGDICYLYVPSAFSPNQDGVNDVFKPKYLEPIDHYHLEVFDRWGGLLFESTDPDKGWDGSYQGNLQPVGAYVWILHFRDIASGNMIEKKGAVTLIR